MSLDGLTWAGPEKGCLVHLYVFVAEKKRGNMFAVVAKNEWEQ